MHENNGNRKLRLLLVPSLVAALWLCLTTAPFETYGGSDARPPKPLGTNKDLVLPQASAADGQKLHIRFHVRKDGSVERWELVEFPEGVDRSSVASTVNQWKFDPARSAHGIESDGVYDYYQFPSGDLRYELARVYPMASRDLMTAFLDLVHELDLRLKTADERRGVFITKYLRVNNKTFPDLAVPDRIVPRRVQFHVFIPQGSEPGRMYVNARLDAWDKSLEQSMLYYSVGGMESWLFSQLEAAVGSKGHALPRDVRARLETFERLMPGSNEGCVQERPLLSGMGGVSDPVAIESTKLPLIFPPAEEHPGGESARVVLNALVFEDGVVGNSHVLMSNARNFDFNVTSKQTIAFWRYEPAILDGCPVTVHLTVIVEFTQ